MSQGGKFPFLFLINGNATTNNLSIQKSERCNSIKIFVNVAILLSELLIILENKQ